MGTLSSEMQRQGITTKKLAELVGYSIHAVKAWRAGRRTPSRGAQVLLRQALGLTSEELHHLLQGTNHDQDQESR